MPDILRSIKGSLHGLSQGGRLLSNPAGLGAYAHPMVVFNSTAASTAISNDSAETVFDKYATIPGSILQPGTLIQVRFQGIATATNSSDTLAIKLYFHTAATLTGGTTLISIPATDAANDNVFTGEYELAIRTAGASGTCVGVGVYKSIPAAEGTMTSKDDILASTAIDTTGNIYIGATATWSVASSSNSCRLDVMRVIVA